jgi:hypothetical protein
LVWKLAPPSWLLPQHQSSILATSSGPSDAAEFSSRVVSALDFKLQGDEVGLTEASLSLPLIQTLEKVTDSALSAADLTSSNPIHLRQAKLSGPKSVSTHIKTGTAYEYSSNLLA